MKADRACLLWVVFLFLFAIRAGGTVYYVNAANSTPAPPFTSWETAATNIQDAINFTTDGDTVLVTNGVYAFGGLVMDGDLTNRVALTNAITVESVNGPWVTAILGAGATNGPAAVRCAWLTNGATLTGFTLTAGATRTTGDAGGLESGGGIWCASSNAFVNNCVIVSNTAHIYGSGAYQGSVSASLIISNAAAGSGGAAYATVLNNCTIVSNAYYGVVSPMAMTNCIVYFNSPANYSVNGSPFSHCCTTPALAGAGNITNAPQLLADGAHLAPHSPCIGAGAGIPTGTDIFGNAWSNPPSIGCAEWSSAPVILTAPATQFPPTGGVAIGVVVAGQPPFSCGWLKDGTPVQADGNHSAVDTTALLINNFALSDAGAYQVVVSNFTGMATSVVAQVVAHCVAPGGAAAAPYSDWTSAATNIQDAIDVAQAGDVILVTNGLYAFGGLVMDGTQSNRVALNQAIMVQSVNGPWVTTIQGGNRTNGAPMTRCAWLTNGAALVGFTLEGGATPYVNENGGGVWCASSNAIVANSLICSNLATGQGGGAYSGTLRNCAIFGNNSSQGGGGTAYGCLYNCTVTGNFAISGGGGTYSSPAMTNCIVYYNSNNSTANIYGPGPASFCCTYPLPSAGVGNLTNAPQIFPDHVHLFNNSPCIGAGTNLGATTDIDGQLWNNPPSIGCSEAAAAPLVATPILQLTNNPVGFVIGAAIAGAGQLTCWWLENGIPLENNGQFSSSQTASLTVPSPSFANAGAYQLVVSNSFGVVTSAMTQVIMHCVDANGTHPVAPYLTWDTAATGIQDAITAAAPGDIVLVTNGLYATGGISMDGIITNRVSVNKAILVESVNGAAATIIQGAWDPASTNGPGAVRCAWMTNNAMLSGFTIQGGATRSSGSASNPSMYGGGVWGTTNNVVINCNIAANFASYFGGGACGVTLENCTLTGNHVVGAGSSANGGGAEKCSLRNCFLLSNFADQGSGGGADNCILQNCAMMGNSGYMNGGAANGGTLVNCTVTANTSSGYSSGYGAAVYGATLTNCIVIGNFSRTAYPNTNYASCTLSYCCADPLPAGNGNIDVNPLLLPDNLHLSASSPCIGAGTGSAASGTDIDGQPWNNPPSIGCDEWQPAPVIAVQPAFQIGVPVHGLTCTVVTAGAPSSNLWTANGVLIQDNGHYSHSGTPSLAINNFGPADAGFYQVIVTNVYGAATSAVAQIVIHAVNAAGSNPEAPFSTWDTAATNIQDAINVSSAGDIVLVTNGVYANGGLAVSGALTNRVALIEPVTVISANGFGATVIQGAWDPTGTNGPAAVRCAYIANGAVLNGFTLCNGATLAGNTPGGPLDSGGGVFCGSASGQAVNCVLSNNSAVYGGGIANGTLNNSLVVENQADYGGGAYSATLNNCTVEDNAALVSHTGGAGINFGLLGITGAVRNSIIVNNYDVLAIPETLDNYYLVLPSSSAVAYCCSSPLPSGTGNIDVTPQFLDWYHIASTSPCVGAGSAAYASGYDLDGEAWNIPPSMGCDEVVLTNLVGPLSVNIVSVWTNLLVNRIGDYSGVIAGRASWVQWAFGDGVTVSNTGAGAGHEWTNAGDYTVTFTAYNHDHPQGVAANLPVTVQPLAMPELQLPALTTNGIVFQFGGQNDATYTIQYSTNLAPPVTWQTLDTIYFNTQTNLQIADPSATNGTRFYRVRVQ